MNRTLAFVIAPALLSVAAEAVAQGSWAFAPGAYTHDPRTGTRTTQFTSHEPVEGLPDPRQTVSRYWQTRTNLRGADGSSDTIYEVRSFGNTLGGFDAQRERGFDAQQQTLDALTPFRFNPYLFFGGTQGFGFGYPGYPGAVPGTPIPAPQGNFQGQQTGGQTAPCQGPGCAGGAPAPPQQGPYPGQPGTAYPYAPPSNFVAPPFYPFGFGYGGPGFGGPGFGGPGFGGVPPWWGYGPGRGSYVPGR